MNRNIYALLTAAVIGSVLSVAQAETMEERKQRIMRKYMRERQDIVQGDFAMPEAVQEDVRVVESEQFNELEEGFERQKGVTMPRRVQPYQPVPLESERSWWLETAELEEDPLANPFSSKADAGEESGDSWSPWSKRDDSSAYGSAYGQQRDDREDAYPGSQSAFGMQTESGNGSPVSGMPYKRYTSRRSPATRESDQMPGVYGRQQTDTRATDSRWGLDSAVRYESSPSPGLIQSSLPSRTDTQGWSSQNKIPGYTPYKSPYQAEGNEQRRYGGNLQSQSPQYTRPNNYQKWKDSNKAWDSTSDNLYLDELMRNDRR